MCNVRTSAMVSALKLETQTQYGVRDDQYEVLKSSACLQESIMLLLLSLASLFIVNSHALKPSFLILPFSFFLCRKVKAVTLNFGLLAVQSQEERTKKRESPLPCSPVLHKTQTWIPAPPFQMLYASFSRQFKMKQTTRESGQLKRILF